MYNVQGRLELPNKRSVCEETRNESRSLGFGISTRKAKLSDVPWLNSGKAGILPGKTWCGSAEIFVVNSSERLIPHCILRKSNSDWFLSARDDELMRKWGLVATNGCIRPSEPLKKLELQFDEEFCHFFPILKVFLQCCKRLWSTTLRNEGLKKSDTA